VKRLFVAAFIVVAGWFTLPLRAQSVDLGDLIGKLRQGGHVIVMRHGGTNRDQADTDPLNLDNVVQQRQLSESGRDTARQVGDPAGVGFDVRAVRYFDAETGAAIAPGS